MLPLFQVTHGDRSFIRTDFFFRPDDVPDNYALVRPLRCCMSHANAKHVFPCTFLSSVPRSPFLSAS